MEQLGWPEASVLNYNFTLRRSHFHRDGSRKLLILKFLCNLLVLYLLCSGHVVEGLGLRPLVC